MTVPCSKSNDRDGIGVEDLCTSCRDLGEGFEFAVESDQRLLLAFAMPG